MNAVTATSTTKQQLWQREAEAFRKIPGMDLLLRSQRETLPDLEVKYPDAAFACMIADNLFVGDAEQNEIHQKAYLSILNGESISSVRFQYSRDTEAYLNKHMWD